MKKFILAMSVALGAVSAKAGDIIECHPWVETDHVVKSRVAQNFVVASARNFDAGCAQVMEVTFKFKGVSESFDPRKFEYSVIRQDPVLGPVPEVLIVENFSFQGNDQLTINQGLRSGDTVFLKIPSAGFFPFHIE